MDMEDIMSGSGKMHQARDANSRLHKILFFPNSCHANSELVLMQNYRH